MDSYAFAGARRELEVGYSGTEMYLRASDTPSGLFDASQVIAEAKRQGQYREQGVREPRCGKDGRACYEDIGHAMHAEVFVDHPILRVSRHSRRSRVVVGVRVQLSRIVDLDPLQA